MNKNNLFYPTIPEHMKHMFDLDSNEMIAEDYYPLNQLVYEGHNTIYTEEINKDNWESYLNAIRAILKDGIDKEYIQSIYSTIIFPSGEDVDLYITDLYFNFIFWGIIVFTNRPIEAHHLFFEDAITRQSIKYYIDKNLLMEYKDLLDNKEINLIIHNCIKRLAQVDEFAYYIANTYSLNDDIEMMNNDKEVYDYLHLDLSEISLLDNKEFGMNITNKYIQKIKNSNHCLSNSLLAQEATNPKQFKEQYINIGAKPNGAGGVFPYPINSSFINGGLDKLSYIYTDSYCAVYAQIMSKNNVGDTGSFARIISLNNIGLFLNPDPNFSCHSRNFQEIVIENERMFDLYIGRYYRLHPDGMEYKLTPRHTDVIGKKIYLRSPMTCESERLGNGICHRCYGELYYTNYDLDIGQIASETFSAEITQRMLSAKHLLEPNIKKLIWSVYIDDILSLTKDNTILISSDTDLTGYKLIINTEEISSSEDGFFDEDEKDSVQEFNENITEFTIQTPNGELKTVYGSDSDGNKATLYINQEFKNYIKKKFKVRNIENIEDDIIINLKDLAGLEIVTIEYSNDELSKVFNNTRSIINKNDVTTRYNRHEILNKLIYEAIISGGLHVNPVHLEVILSNQIRAVEDEDDPKSISFVKPDWSIRNPKYKVITLNTALTYNASVTVSLMYQKMKMLFKDPKTFKKRKASNLDLLFMKYPQQYIDESHL